MNGTALAGTTWRRDDEIVEQHRRRWARIRATLIALGVGAAVIAWLAGGLGGVALIGFLALLGAATFALVAMGSRGDAAATVKLTAEELVIDGVLPDRVSVSEIDGARVFTRAKAGATPTGQGMRRKTYARELTLIELDRHGDRERHLVLNGYLPVRDDEVRRLRALLGSRFPELVAEDATDD